MRIGIISDIHGNVSGLEQALEAMGQVDEILCAGDLVYQYRFSNEVIEIVRSLGVKCVRGNHEDIIISHHGANLRASGTIKPENLRYITNLPIRFEEQIDGKKFYMVHGSPWDPLREYVMPQDRRIEQMKEIDADVVVMGHTHFPMVRKVGKVLVINPGSCGDPRDHSYGLRLTFAVLDTETGEAEIRVIEEAEGPSTEGLALFTGV
ncbi:MAG: metallophosphoesterase family protein [Dehalococcoidia bacterium]|nr:metallophosphoesterase family protein [Dehalococcoidia bacterium]